MENRTYKHDSTSVLLQNICYVYENIIKLGDTTKLSASKDTLTLTISEDTMKIGKQKI